MHKQVFEAGQKVVATGSYNWLLTKGKEYSVVRYEAPVETPTFTWPAYVTVIGDSGREVTCIHHGCPQ